MKASKAAKATDNKATKAYLKASKYKQKAAKGGGPSPSRRLPINKIRDTREGRGEQRWNH